MSSNAPTPIPKAKRRGIPLQSGKTTGAGLCARFLRLPALPRSQRGLPLLPALHDIHDATVIDSDAYRRNGGGHFARWQSAIADWHRHLYLTNNTLREVAPDEVLLLGDTAEDLPVAAPILLQPRPGDRTNPVCRHPPTRQPTSPATTAAVFIYQPITARLRNPAQRA